MKEKSPDQILRDKLIELELIDENFTGKMTVNINQGGVTDIERSEFIIIISNEEK